MGFRGRMAAPVPGVVSVPGRRWRALQSRDDGSVQFAGRRDADGREGEQPDELRRGTDRETVTRAKTLTLDTKTNHILLIAAQYGPPPSPPPAGGRAGRGQMVPDSFSILVVGK